MTWMHEFTRCRPWLEAALEYSGGDFDIADVAALLAEGKVQLWPGEKAAIITEMMQYPKKAVLNFFLAGGDLDELQKMTPHIEQWAKEQGCSRVSLHGRRGWDRTFLTKELGYRPEWWVLAKEI